MTFSIFIGAGVVFFAFMSLLVRFTTGFKATYVPGDLVTVIIAILGIFTNTLVWYNDPIAGASAISAIIWLYITWRDWGRRNRRKAVKKLLGDKSRRMIEKLKRSMPRPAVPRLVPQPA